VASNVAVVREMSLVAGRRVQGEIVTMEPPGSCYC